MKNGWRLNRLSRWVCSVTAAFCCSLIGFVIGMSLFGSVTFLPLYLQVVKEATPTEAGLQLIL